MKVFFLFLAMLVAFPAMAHEDGDVIVRVGAAMVDPDVSSDVIDVAGIVTLPGVDVDDNTQVGITAAWMWTSNVGIELLAATPFTHDIEVADVGVSAGDTKHLPPTLMLQYYPIEGNVKFNPYVGIGVNTTIFFDEDVDDELNAALDGIVGLPPGTVDADLDLDQSWGLAAQVGFDYMIDEKWLINGAIWYIDIDTEAKISTAIADLKFDVEIDPWVYMLSVGYKF